MKKKIVLGKERIKYTYKNKKTILLLVIVFMLFGGILTAQQGTGNSGAGGNGSGSTSGPAPAGGEDSGGKVSDPGAGGENSASGDENGGNDGNDGGKEEKDSNRNIVTGSAAINHVQNGGDVKHVSTSALREGIQACGDNPDLKDVKAALQAELNSRDKVSEMEEKALNAEDAYAEAMKEYLAAENRLKQLEKELNELGDKMKDSSYGEIIENVADYQAACEAYVNEKNEVEKKREAAETAKNEAQAAYETLSLTYNEAGDPVKVGTGEYLLTYTDFEAIDEITHFKVTRNYSYSDYIESFGRNWNCSLDSRIIYCRDFDYSEIIAIFKKMIPIAKKGKEWLEAYNRNYPSNPRKSLDSKLKYIREQIELYEKAEKNLTKCQNDGTSIDLLNKKVAYGRYSEVNSRFGLNNRIIYVDPEGISHTFTYDPATSTYHGIDFYSKQQISLKLQKNPNFDIFNNKYFGDSEEARLALIEDQLEFEMRLYDGTVRYFTSFGVLKAEIDRNGNRTTYESGKSGRIEKINLPTGETINVSRYSNGLIKSISGSYSGTTNYTYSTDKITNVSFNNKLRVSYDYDYLRHLSKIVKADGRTVSISYSDGKVIRVIDENGNSESFSYNQNLINHTTLDGGKETFITNDVGNTIKKTDTRGVVYTIDTDGYGRPSVESFLGVKKIYSYNDKGLISSISYSSGGTEYFTYNDLWQITNHTDCDGFSRTYKYDSYGNITEIYYSGKLQSSLSYYGTGLVEKLYEKDDVYTYSYNTYGQLISRTRKDKSGQTRSETYSYNSNGKLSCYKDYYGNTTNYSYSDNYMKEVNSIKEIEHFYNSRQWEIKTVYKDLITGKAYTKTCDYDGNGNVTKIYLDGKLYGEYEYTSNNQLKSFTLWNNIGSKNYKTLRQGIKTIYSFNNSGCITEEKKSVVSVSDNKKEEKLLIPIEVENKLIKRCSYSINSNGVTVYEYQGNITYPNIYKYDSYDRLIQRTSPTGYSVYYTYSKAGRLLEISDSDGKKVVYKYNSDGSAGIIAQKADGSKSVKEYNSDKLLTKFTDYEGNATSYSYDNNGNLKTIIKPDSKVVYSYDSKNRKTAETIYEKNGNVFYSKKTTYNDSKNQKIENFCDLETVTYSFDGFNRLIRKSEKNLVTNYEYDILGNIEKITNSVGDVFEYEYTPGGNITYETFGNEVIRYTYDCCENCLSGVKNDYVIFSNEYNNNGALTKKINQFGEEVLFEYAPNGKKTAVSKSDTGKQKITEGNNIFSFTSENDTEYSYKIGTGGLIESESVNNKKREYVYDKNERLIYKKNYSGKTEKYTYDIPNRRKSVEFSNGEKHNVTTNLNGQITQLETNNYKLDYKYNLWGRIEHSDNSVFDCPVSYSYDSYGRCINKKSKYFDFNYYYDANNLVNKITEKKSGFELNLEYDDKKREIRRVFSNGADVCTGYLKNEKAWIVEKNAQNLVQFANFVLHDEAGRINCICNEKGEITKFNYDKKGRLIEVYSPYTDEICNFAYKEAVECGLFIKNEKPEGCNFNLSEKEFLELTEIIKAAGLNSKISIAQYNYGWKEEYTYTSTGSVASVKNPFGKIYYEYDCENRITRKWAGNKSTSSSTGMEIFWDKDGNLIKVLSGFREISFKYNALNKPEVILSKEKLENNKQSVLVIEYLYDPLGRICKEIINGSEAYEYIYDGIKNQILCKIPVTENEIGVSRYSTILMENENADDLDKRIIQDSSEIDYEKFPKTRDFASWNYSSSISTKEFMPEEIINPVVKMQCSFEKDDEYVFDKRSSCFLYLFGVPVYCFYEDSNCFNGYESEYLITNYLSQIVQILDKNSLPKYTNSYDTWGNSINGGKNLFYSNGFNYGHWNLCLYDLQNRFYFPLLKTFISEDPAKDGGNYFAYCATDPVNYCDYSGFAKNGCTNAENAAYTKEVFEYGSFNGDKQKKNGTDKGIPYSFDCADSSAAVDTQCSSKAGINNYSDMATEFNNRYDPNSPDGQKNPGSNKSSDKPQNYAYSAQFWNEGVQPNENVVMTSSDPKALRDPSIVTPGTVLVIAPNANKEGVPDGKKTSYGHTITVIARDFDANGNIIGMIVLENHVASEGNVCYMVIEGATDAGKNQWRYDAWRGEYVGTFEIEGQSHADMNNRRNCGL